MAPLYYAPCGGEFALYVLGRGVFIAGEDPQPTFVADLSVPDTYRGNPTCTFSCAGRSVFFCGRVPKGELRQYALDVPSRHLQLLSENDLSLGAAYFSDEVVIKENRLYFLGPSAAGDGDAARALWVTDGTPSGTMRLADGPGRRFPGAFLSGLLFFTPVMQGQSSGDALWAIRVP